MASLSLIFPGLFFLYFTRRKMTIELAKLVGDRRMFIWLWSLVFLPGTIIHEVSHFLAAALTGARTGKIEIFPRNDKKSIHLGYVQTQRLNPIRGFIVGLAPLITGLGLLIFIASPSHDLASLDSSSQLLRMTEMVEFFLKLYFFFTVANSLFLSWADVKQTLPLVVIGIILGGILWIAGVQIKIGPESPIWNIAKSLSSALWISIGINAGIDAALWTINKILLI